MPNLDYNEMQGFIARGYGKLPAAAYLLIEIEEASAARQWLESQLPRITPSAIKPHDVAHHIAFTRLGLEAIGMKPEDLKTFAHPFYEGMTSKRRTRILGDLDQSAPEKWDWGNPEKGNPVHALLMIFAVDEHTLKVSITAMRTTYKGVKEHRQLDTFAFQPAREHFGFRDGIAQPIIKGFSRKGPEENTLPPGEFILGYENAYGTIASGPIVALNNDPKEILPKIQVEEQVLENGRYVSQKVAVADFGRNGSYLVFRQMSQDVKGFWNFITEASAVNQKTGAKYSREELAAKMVGRWKNGTPLTSCPMTDKGKIEDINNFNYADDLEGTGCPIGAHIRRTNPRAALEGSTKESIKIANRHRLLRRGRPYGEPVSATFDVDEILASKDHDQEVGLHFICLNSDLERQFEFVQHTWVNNTKFAGLYSDSDPIIGNQDPKDGTFTIQAEPVRDRVNGMKKFVSVRGGAYFFLPSLSALRYLTSL